MEIRLWSQADVLVRESPDCRCWSIRALDVAAYQICPLVLYS